MWARSFELETLLSLLGLSARAAPVVRAADPGARVVRTQSIGVAAALVQTRKCCQGPDAHPGLRGLIVSDKGITEDREPLACSDGHTA